MENNGELLELFVRHLKETHRFSEKETANFLKPKHSQIPITLFRTRKLSSLEVIVKYLKEVIGLRFCDIAKLLNRNDRTIWATYEHVKQKLPGILKAEKTKITIQLELFQDRRLSILEHIVTNLKESCQFSNQEIASILNRDPNTIWTVLNRASRKK